MDFTKLPTNAFALGGLFILVFFTGFFLPLMKAVLKSMERNTDRVVESNDKIGTKVEALKETLTDRDHKLIELLADRDERLIARITEAVMVAMNHQASAQMDKINQILTTLALLTDGRMGRGGERGAAEAHALLETLTSQAPEKGKHTDG